MKLATFNINGIRARLPRLLEWLEREKPDVACLQELKCADEQLPDRRHRGLRDMALVWHGQKGFNGVATYCEVTILPSFGGSAFRAIPTTRTAATSRSRPKGFIIVIALFAERQSDRHREVRL